MSHLMSGKAASVPPKEILVSGSQLVISHLCLPCATQMVEQSGRLLSGGAGGTRSSSEAPKADAGAQRAR
eukprot:6195334-Pleurochrysis_carterae.AAC.1